MYFSLTSSIFHIILAVAIKLAGGTVEDLSELDAFDPKSLEPKKTPVKKKVQVDKPTDNHSPENSRGKRQVNEDFKVSPKVNT